MVLSRSLGFVQSRTHMVLSTFRVERLTPLLTNPSWKLPHRRAQRFVSSVSVDPAKLTVFIVTVACMLACLLHSFLPPPLLYTVTTPELLPPNCSYPMCTSHSGSLQVRTADGTCCTSFFFKAAGCFCPHSCL